MNEKEEIYNRFVDIAAGEQGLEDPRLISEALKERGMDLQNVPII